MESGKAKIKKQNSKTRNEGTAEPSPLSEERLAPEEEKFFGDINQVALLMQFDLDVRSEVMTNPLISQFLYTVYDKRRLSENNILLQQKIPESL